MASSKKKTTMNKLNRERKLRERRLDKQAKKIARANGELPTQAEPIDDLPFVDEFQPADELEPADELQPGDEPQPADELQRLLAEPLAEPVSPAGSSSPVEHASPRSIDA